jgi:hypothetical protein
MYPYTPPAYVPPPPLPTPTPAPKRKGNKRAAVLLIGGLGGILLVGAIAANGSPPKTTSTTTADGATTVPRSTTTATSESSMSAWSSATSPSLSRLGDDMSDASSAASSYDISGMRSACRSMSSSIYDVRAHLPAPDAVVTRELSAALTDFANGAQSCLTFTSTLDASAADDTADYMGSGSRHIANAKAAIDRD